MVSSVFDFDVKLIGLVQRDAVLVQSSDEAAVAVRERSLQGVAVSLSREADEAFTENLFEPSGGFFTVVQAYGGRSAPEADLHSVEGAAAPRPFRLRLKLGLVRLREAAQGGFQFPAAGQAFTDGARMLLAGPVGLLAALSLGRAPCRSSF